MLEQSQKERFVGTMVSNVDYINKELAAKHICEFLKARPSFSPRQAIRKVATDSYFSFIEITGFIQIAKCYVEMYIGVPVEYPSRPPVFLLAIDRNHFSIHEEQRLLQFNLIANQKNEKNQDFVRLRFPIIEKQWNPKIQNINSAFNNLMQAISSPPLIRPKHEMQPGQNQPKQTDPDSVNKIKRLNSKQVTQAIGKVYTDIVEVLIGKQSLDESAQILDYNESREHFFKAHLLTLKSKLGSTLRNIEDQFQSLTNDLKETETKGNCDHLLELSQQETTKLAALSEQQALREAEVKLRYKMEKGSGKFSDYKKIMKILYENMFENQTKLLRSLK